MKVVVTAPAHADLQAIGDWIARDNRRRALTFIEELEEACAALAENPLRFQLVPGRASRGVRRRIHGNYVIFYTGGPAEVTVLRVLHGARNYEPLLFPEDDPPEP
ncbi:MAG TPA: type II toxin-antitoxin system RelE/ParE family toxin [Caulobacteraceae bacterium]|nr:type II toxin-antitoxin system RelE/ParE family toxin [Caulobacteraceae bacterium]